MGTTQETISLVLQAETSKAVRAIRGVTRDVNRMAREIQKTSRGSTQSLNQMNKGFLGLAENLDQTIKKVALWTISTGAVFGAMGLMRRGIGVIKDFDSQMVDLQKVYQGSAYDLEILKNEILDSSVAMGSLTSQTMKAAISLGRMGKTRAEIAELTRIALLSQNIAELDAAEATKLLNAALLQFEKTADDAINILDKWNELSNRTPVTTQDLASAMSIAGAVFHQAGGEIESLNAMVSTLTATMAKSGNEVGTALKTISSYIYRQSTMKKIMEITGIAVKDQMGNLMDIDELLSRLSAKWTTLTEAQQTELSQASAGVRQKGFFLNLMQNFNMVLENQTIQWQAAGSAMEENEIRLGSLATKVNQLQAAFEKLAVNEGDSGLILPALKGLTDGLRQLVENLSEVHAALQIVAGVGTALALKQMVHLTFVFGTATTASAGLTRAMGFLNKSIVKWTVGLAAGIAIFNGLVYVFNIHDNLLKRQKKNIESFIASLKKQGQASKSIIAAFEAYNTIYSEYLAMRARGEDTAVQEERLAVAMDGINQIQPGLITDTDSYADALSKIKTNAEDAAQSIKDLSVEMLLSRIQLLEMQLPDLELDLVRTVGKARGLFGKRNLGGFLGMMTMEDPAKLEMFNEAIEDIGKAEKFRKELLEASNGQITDEITQLNAVIVLMKDINTLQEGLNRMQGIVASGGPTAPVRRPRSTPAVSDEETEHDKRVKRASKRVSLELSRGISDSMVLAVTDGATRIQKLQVWNRVGQNMGDIMGSVAAQRIVDHMKEVKMIESTTGFIGNLAKGGIGGLISGGIGMISQLLFPVNNPIDRNTEATEESVRSIRELNDTMRDFQSRYTNAPSTFQLGSLSGGYAGGDQNIPYMSSRTYNNQSLIQNMVVNALPGQSAEAIADMAAEKFVKAWNRGGIYDTNPASQ